MPKSNYQPENSKNILHKNIQICPNSHHSTVTERSLNAAEQSASGWIASHANHAILSHLNHTFTHTGYLSYSSVRDETAPRGNRTTANSTKNPINGRRMDGGLSNLQDNRVPQEIQLPAVHKESTFMQGIQLQITFLRCPKSAASLCTRARNYWLRSRVH